MSAFSSLARRAPILPLAIAALVACGSTVSSAELPGDRVRRLEAGDSLPNLTRPAGFAGTLPCADCAGIETWLLLNPDGSYRLRERYLEGDAAPRLSVGRWSINRDSVPQVALFGRDSLPRRFAMTGALTLRALATDGSVIESEQPLELVRVSMPEDLRATAKLRGEFRYMADAATLVACDGGMLFPVSGDAEFVRLQRAHREQSLGAGAAILVDIEGQLQWTPGMEEGTRAETFVVTGFEVVDRKETCASTTTLAYIAIGDWQLGALDGVALPELSSEWRPTLRFVLNDPEMFGHGGCNRLSGRPVFRGLLLLPGAIAGTKKACAEPGVMEREARYAQVLGSGGWFRLDGQELVLSMAGRETARFWRR